MPKRLVFHAANRSGARAMPSVGPRRRRGAPASPGGSDTSGVTIRRVEKFRPENPSQFVSSSWVTPPVQQHVATPAGGRWAYVWPSVSRTPLRGGEPRCVEGLVSEGILRNEKSVDDRRRPAGFGHTAGRPGPAAGV